MKKLATYISLILFVLLAVSSAHAQGSTPEETVRQVINQMKKSGGPEGMLNYIHWETALKNIPEHEKNEFKITTADDLRKFYKVMFSDPSAFMRARMQSKLSKMTDEQRALVNKQLDQMTQVMQGKIAEQKEKLSATKFVVGQAVVNGDKAKIDIESSLEGRSKKSSIELIKVDGRWLFPGLQMVEEKS